MKQLFFLACILLARSSYSMDVATKPKTLFDHFKIAEMVTLPPELQDIVAKKIIGTGGWWYFTPFRNTRTSEKRHSDSCNFNKVAFNRDGSILGGATTGRIATSLTNSGISLAQIVDKNKDLTSFAFDQKSSLLAVAGESSITLISTESQTNKKFGIRLNGNAVSITDLVFHPTEKIIMFCTKANNTTGGLFSFFYDKHIEFRTSYVANRDFYVIKCNKLGTLLAGGHAHGFCLQNVNSEHLTEVYNDEQVKALAFHPLQDMIVIGSENGLIAFYDFNGNKLKDIQSNDAVTGLAFNADGTLFVSSSAKKAYLWDCNGNKLRTFYCKERCNNIAFHPLKNSIALATDDGVALLRKYEHPTLQQVLLRQLLKDYLVTHITSRENPTSFFTISEETVPSWLATEYELDRDELTAIWESIPEELRHLIYWTTLNHAIENSHIYSIALK